MRKPLALLGVSALVGLSTVLIGGPASAATIVTYDIRDDWDTSDTRNAGNLEITEDGLHVWTDDNSSQAKVAAYRKAPDGLNLKNVGKPSLDWEGTNPAPGLQLVIDIRGGTGADGILVGESVYGDNWWLTPGSSQELKDADPSGANNGGNGSEWFGTLAQWSEALKGDGWISAVGFSLGSGVKGDGVIKSMTFGDNTYTFKLPKVVTPAPVTQEENVSDATCEKPGELTLPEVEGVKYSRTPETGTGEVTVTATAEVGYKLAEGNWEWKLTIPDKLTGEQCEVDTTPTATPTATATATPTTNPTVEPTNSPTVAPTNSAEPTPSMSPAAGLPVTGDNSMKKLGVVGGGAVAVATIILVALRLTRRNNDETVTE